MFDGLANERLGRKADDVGSGRAEKECRDKNDGQR
jgi:hypothetical protein